jgi:hypothetical protein
MKNRAGTCRTCIYRRINSFGVLSDNNKTLLASNEKRTLYVKGLSHEMDLTFDDMLVSWLVLGLNRGRDHFKSF